MSALAPARLRAAFAPAPARTRSAAAAPARTRSAASARGRLRVVAAAPVAARVPFAILVGAILAAGLVALLMLHTLAAQDAFTLHDLQHRAAALADTEQQLAVDDQQAAAPTTLAARARALGMVPTGDLTITRRRDGRVVAVARALPPPQPAPSPSASASPSAKASPAGKTSPAAQQGAAAKAGSAGKPAHSPAPRPHRSGRH